LTNLERLAAGHKCNNGQAQERETALRPVPLQESLLRRGTYEP
jgi:hypothetical protein